MATPLFHAVLDWKLFLSTFVVIFIAELPDKTALAVLMVSSRRNPLGIYLGVCAAYLVHNSVAVLAGSFLTLLPHHWVQTGAGILFIVFALMMWLQRGEARRKPQLERGVPFWKSAWTGFFVIFVAEWGDLTQLATATLAAKSGQPLTIYLASTSALWIASSLFVLAGYYSQKFIPHRLLQILAGLAFGVVGILLLLGWGNN